jgi:hypothetical protein
MGPDVIIIQILQVGQRLPDLVHIEGRKPRPQDCRRLIAWSGGRIVGQKI